MHELLKRLYLDSCLIIDTETGSLRNPRHIIDLAVVEFPTGKVLFNSLIKSPQRVHYYTSKVHGLYDSDLYSAPQFKEIWQSLSKIINDGRVILAYNSVFDSKALYENLNYHNLSPYPQNWECLMKIYQQFRGYGKSVSLEYACSEMNVRSGNHRAKEDALAAARVLYRMCQSFSIV